MEITDNFKDSILEKLQKAETCLRTSIELSKKSFNHDVIMTNNMYYAINYMNSVRHLLEINDIVNNFSPDDIVEIIVESESYYDDYDVEIPKDCDCTDLFGLKPQKDDRVKDLKWTIDVRTGNIKGWPKGMKASTNFKLADAGIYSLLANDGVLIRKYDGYVPCIFNIKANEFGDYLHLDIDENGHIVNWEQDFRYESSGKDGKITFNDALKELLYSED